MSGHSKWHNIAVKKGKTDAARGKIFTKIGREIAIAVREGGSADPNANSKLKDCIAKAKANNVPNDNIERIIKKAAGDGNAEQYEAITYEGYGPHGIAIFVDTLTGQGFTACAPYNGAQWAIGAEGAVCLQEGTKVRIQHKVSEGQNRAATVFQRLVSAGKRLLRVIEHNEGGANKDLAKFADQINALCDKWDR